MAKKPGKNIDKARKLVELRPYKLNEASEVIKKAHFVKFDETVELVVNLGVDPKHSDQMVRGTVVLPAKKFAKRRKRARISSAAKIWCRKFRKAGPILTRSLRRRT
jgi:large subunit ribosomal protein L1